MQTSTSEIVLASVVHLSKVKMDRGMTQAEWNNSHALRHFSIIRKLDGRPFPPGQSTLLAVQLLHGFKAVSSSLLKFACQQRRNTCSTIVAWIERACQ